MSAVKLCGAGILCLSALLCVKNLKEGYAPLLRIASTVIFSLAVLSMLSQPVEFIKTISSESGLAECGEIVMKALGIAYLTNFTSSICRDSGENGLAGRVEAVGRIELLLLALPLFLKILSAAEVMLSW